MCFVSLTSSFLWVLGSGFLSFHLARLPAIVGHRNLMLRVQLNKTNPRHIKGRLSCHGTKKLLTKQLTSSKTHMLSIHQQQPIVQVCVDGVYDYIVISLNRSSSNLPVCSTISEDQGSSLSPLTSSEQDREMVQRNNDA